ncbi:hypothetical protein [Entomospira culicis]|uniref:Uncharacterized protein n=1 Tax=Entomospira culicis TaxID=2719989 RepID=A0A968GIU2_9SPIO|nr:hypothetical protein [Entomospira culicis]NIZ19346.1 hypothetical protein [Entomospira culicis]NIZ69749.1 hypothetical protein [Entomospira culicis]WDI36860.1 hypothetical protein PVA46_05915 [Entomospira culicis]WDI38489.1 hypothetical protein PVA47_05925 [Entomospira culicis]
MEQIPFLFFTRVVVTILGGFFLAHSTVIAKVPSFEGLYRFLNTSSTSRLTLAFSAMLIGVISLLMGKFYLDFFPAFASITVATVIFLEEYLANNGAQNQATSFLSKYALEYKKHWGLFAMFVGLLHLFAVNLPWL